MTWKPGDPLPGARRGYERGPLLGMERDGARCLEGSCWHHADTPLVQLGHEVYRWRPGDPIVRFGAPTEQTVTPPAHPPVHHQPAGPGR
jgi:hypothetical protein